MGEAEEPGEGSEELEITPGDSGGGRKLALWALFVEFLRRLVGLYFDVEISKIRRRYRDAENRYRKLERKLRLFGVLAFTVLVFALFAFVVWTLVGVMWLVDNTPASANPFYLAAGVVIGYLASLLAGLVYSR